MKNDDGWTYLEYDEPTFTNYEDWLDSGVRVFLNYEDFKNSTNATPKGIEVDPNGFVIELKDEAA